MVKVSIVAAYNSKIELTIQFLDTMFNLTTLDNDMYREFILVNGGSTTKIKHPIITKRIDLPFNKGFCNTLNYGLREVSPDTDYVFFVGNDSFPTDESWLMELIDLQKRTGAWMVCPANDNPGMQAYNHLYRKDCGEYWEVDMFPSIAWLMPYDKFKIVGLLDEGYVRTGMYADDDYCARIRLNNGLIAVSKDILLKHLLSAEGRLLGTQDVDMVVNGEYFRNKWVKKDAKKE